MSEIASASNEQASGIEQVNDAVAALDEVTQQNAALVEEASAASRQALDLADELMREVAFFRLQEQGEAALGSVAVVAEQVRAFPARTGGVVARPGAVFESA